MKTCLNCDHKHVSTKEEPCKSCNQHFVAPFYNNWEGTEVKEIPPKQLTHGLLFVVGLVTFISFAIMFTMNPTIYKFVGMALGWTGMQVSFN